MLKGWKTFLFSLGVALIPVLDMIYSTVQDNAELIDRTTLIVILCIIPIVQVVLRSVTTTPIFKQEQ